MSRLSGPLSLTPRFLLWMWVLLAAVPLSAADDLVQVHQDFNKDPGWEGVNNRVIGVGGPTIHQDFGWSLGPEGLGAVGGEIWAGPTPASYGMPIGPFDLTRKLSASGTITIKRMSGSTAVYFGFYNSTRQGWRPWSSMMLQITPLKAKQIQKYGIKQTDSTPLAMPLFCVIPADWHSDGVSSPRLIIPMDGKPHTWSFAYDPEAKMPDGTARSQVTMQVDGATPYVGLPEQPNLRDHPAVMDRFGMVNSQNYGRDCEIYFSDLTINGQKIDLSKDPGWLGQGNRVSFLAWSFHSRQDYGFMETNWAGNQIGEIGGLFWATELNDPLYGYYADDIGSLSLDDPISFSGNVCFVDGQPDSGMTLGFFNSKSIGSSDFQQRFGQGLGIYIEGPSSVGKQMMSYCACGDGGMTVLPNPPVFQPDRRRRAFAFKYDPKANDGVGRITLDLDGKEYAMNLTPQQRKAGANFDRFGMKNLRGGGKLVIIYFDDLSYTARRLPNYQPIHHDQQFVKVKFR